MLNALIVVKGSNTVDEYFVLISSNLSTHSMSSVRLHSVRRSVLLSYAKMCLFFFVNEPSFAELVPVGLACSRKHERIVAT